MKLRRTLPELGSNRQVTAILDCTYSRRVVRHQLLKRLREDDGLVVVEFRVEPQVALERFRLRASHDAVDLSPQIVIERANTYPYGAASATINGGDSATSVWRQLLSAVDTEDCLDREKWERAGK
jgi:hypothetical protein